MRSNQRVMMSHAKRRKTCASRASILVCMVWLIVKFRILLVPKLDHYAHALIAYIIVVFIKIVLRFFRPICIGNSIRFMVMHLHIR